MKNIIIGTAGHIDHGKSTLIKALTGIETDRLKEERTRGISIDLGFAVYKAENIVASIIDVPGHERFLKNMLAGTGGIDLAMLVVAADEGVMPQTVEHLTMLNYLGIKHGIVVINKVDKVDEEWLRLVEEDIRKLTSKTFLKDAVFCRVSAVSGYGLTKLQAVLNAEIAKLTVRDSFAPFRLWIDRSFNIKGHGVVITGSVLSGSAKIGDTLVLHPANRVVRVRGLECHNNKAAVIIAGQRAAINLAGIEQHEINRGMFLTAEGYGELSKTWDVKINCQHNIANGTRIRLHLGTGEYLGRLYAFKQDSSNYMRLIMEQPLAALAGDVGIIRLYSPQYLLGGVMLIAPNEKKYLSMERKSLAKALEQNNIIDIVYSILNDCALPLSTAELALRSKLIAPSEIVMALESLLNEHKIINIDNLYMTTMHLQKITGIAKQQLTIYPDGLSGEELRQKINLPDKIFEKLLQHWHKVDLIRKLKGVVALTEHVQQYNIWMDEIIAQCEVMFADNSIIDINCAFLIEKFGISPEKAKKIFNHLVAHEELIKIGGIHVYRKTIQYIVSLIQEYFRKNTTLTVAQLRDILNTSRKIALPLLEYLDMHKYTIRQGDVRLAGLKIKELIKN